VNEGGQQWIEETESCHADSYAVHYQRADEILETIPFSLLDRPIRLNPTETGTLVDLYKEDRKVFRAHGIARYEVKVKKVAACDDDHHQSPAGA